MVKRTGVDPTGRVVSGSTVDQQKTGRWYIQCVLDELKLGDIDEWIETAVHAGGVTLERAIGDVFRHMLGKVQRKERWTLPQEYCRSDDERLQGRAIGVNHPKEMVFAFRALINTIRQRPVSEGDAHHGMSTSLVERGWFGNLCGGIYGSVTSQLESFAKSEQSARGTEADQRREAKLYAEDWVELFESILSCAVAEEQRRKGDPERDRLDTLTLGVIVAMQYAIGKRGITLESIRYGYLGVDQFAQVETWDRIKQFLAAVKNVTYKGDRTSGAKHLDEMIHHRCPMRCPIAMQGLYFAYQFFTLRVPLPTLENWNDEVTNSHGCVVDGPGHHRRLLRQQTGGPASVADFNSKLREDLSLIRAVHAAKLSIHSLRDQRISEQGEACVSRPDAHHTAGHGQGSHEKNYRDTDGIALLTGAGYRFVHDPESLSAWVEGLYELYRGCRRDEGQRIVDFLYETHRPDLKALEASLQNDSSPAGKQMRESFEYIRFCILSWVVSSVARPRDESMYIDTTLPIKHRIMVGPRDRGGTDKDILCAHLDCLLVTQDFLQIEQYVRSLEEEEIRLGDLAHRPGSERNVRREMQAGFARVERGLAEMPGALEAAVRPRLDEQSRDLNDEVQLGLDRDYYLSLSPSTRSRRFPPIGLGVSENKVVGTQTLRDARLQHDERERQPTRTTLWNALKGSPSDALASTALARAGPSLVGRSLSAPSAAARLLPPQQPSPGLPVALALPSKPNDDLASNVVPTAATSVAPAAAATALTTMPAALSPAPATSPAATTDLQRQNDQLRAQLATSDEPLPIKQVTGGVRQIASVYTSTVAPKEGKMVADTVTQCREWRSENTVGKTKCSALSYVINTFYEPLMIAVVRLHIDEGKTILQAIDTVEELRNCQDFTAFVKDKSTFLSKFPKLENEPKKRYVQRLLHPQFAEDYKAELVAECAKPEPVESEPQPDLDVASSADSDPLSVPVTDGAATRIVGFDPALCTGFAVVQLDSAGQILSLHVGVLDVSDRSLECDGARCVALMQRLSPLLSPTPDCAFIEPFFGHGRQGDAISVKLRAAIEIEFARREIKYIECAPQTWKLSVTRNGRAEKEEVKAAIELAMRHHFPAKVYANTKWTRDKKKLLDASDATGIALYGVNQFCGHALSFADSFRICALGLRPRMVVGEPFVDARESAPLLSSAGPSLTPAQALPGTSPAPISHAAASPDTVAPAGSPRNVPNTRDCLTEGCRLGFRHAGQCQPCEPSPRKKARSALDLLGLSPRKRQCPSDTSAAL